MALLFVRNSRDWMGSLRLMVLLFSLSQNATATTDDISIHNAVAQGSSGAWNSVQATASWVISSGDSQNLPFVIVDKIAAKLFVFDANGALRASTPVLLGLARGDHSVPGVGKLKVADIPPEDRTTPAGRFVGEPGRNIDGEEIIWIDYDAALSIHRVRPGLSRERRLERIASSLAADKRISYGCVVVPVSFYEQVIATTFGRNKGIIYILPETRSAEKVFDFVQR